MHGLDYIANNDVFSEIPGKTKSFSVVIVWITLILDFSVAIIFFGSFTSFLCCTEHEDDAGGTMKHLKLKTRKNLTNAIKLT